MSFKESNRKDQSRTIRGVRLALYCFGFFTYFAALLQERTAGKIDLFRSEKVKQIALFPGRCYLTANYVASFSDSSLIENYMPGLIHYLKRIFPEVRIPDRKYQAKWGEDSGKRWPHAVHNLIWNDLQFEDYFYCKDCEDDYV